MMFSMKQFFFCLEYRHGMVSIPILGNVETKVVFTAFGLIQLSIFNLLKTIHRMKLNICSQDRLKMELRFVVCIIQSKIRLNNNAIKIKNKKKGWNAVNGGLTIKLNAIALLAYSLNHLKSNIVWYSKHEFSNYSPPA